MSEIHCVFEDSKKGSLVHSLHFEQLSFVLGPHPTRCYISLKIGNAKVSSLFFYLSLSVFDNLEEQLRMGKDKVESIARDKPMRASGIALLVGVGLGVLLRIAAIKARNQVSLNPFEQRTLRGYFFSSNFKAAEFMQYLFPVGAGPSLKTCPRCPPHLLHRASVRSIPSLVSLSILTLSLIAGL